MNNLEKLSIKRALKDIGEMTFPAPLPFLWDKMSEEEKKIALNLQNDRFLLCIRLQSDAQETLRAILDSYEK